MFYDNVRKVCKDLGTTPTTVIKALGHSSGSVTQWKNGTVPSAALALEIAQYLGVSLDYLMTLETPKYNAAITDDQMELLSVYARIPEDKRAMCIDFLRTHAAEPDRYEKREDA